MRNPVFMFAIGIVVVVVSAFLAVQFEYMTLSEFRGKMKTLLFLVLPVAFFIGLFLLGQKNASENRK